jgi:hypothetical protein
MPLTLLCFPSHAPALADWFKAYIHGHYRLNRKTGARIWVDSYTDKRPERGRTEFAHWKHRVGHFEHHLAHGRMREAMHAFHDLNHEDTHRLAVQLGVAHPDEKGDSKAALLAGIHGAIKDHGRALSDRIAGQVKADFERRKAAGEVGKKARAKAAAKDGGTKTKDSPQKVALPGLIGEVMPKASTPKQGVALREKAREKAAELGVPVYVYMEKGRAFLSTSGDVPGEGYSYRIDPEPKQEPAPRPKVSASRDPNAKPRREDYDSAAEHLAAIEAWRENTGNRNEYEEKREERADRLDDAADRARQEANAHHSRADSISQRFYMGQPILVGHHSEKKARRDQERMHNAMRSSIEAHEKAAVLSGRASAARTNTAISSDDEDAVEKLAAKIEQAEAVQARMKAINAAHRRFLKNPASLDSADLTDAEKAQIRAYKPQYSWEPNPIPPYAMQNNNANIKRMKDRLTQLQGQREQRETAEASGGGNKTVPFDGGTIEHNIEANRVQIKFNGKPDEAMRDKLKSRGFRWSPSEKAWQRQLNNAAIYAAESVVGVR